MHQELEIVDDNVDLLRDRPSHGPILFAIRSVLMGHNRRFRRVSDAARYDADVVVACRSRQCGHTVVIERETFLAILQERRVNDDLQVASRVMRCHRCHRRGAIIEITQKGDKRTIGLKDGDPLPPPNIPIGIWIVAHGDERKRLRRIARG